MADYLPLKEADLDAWFLNFSNKMKESGTVHGFSTAEVKRVEDDYEILHALIQNAETLRVNTSEFIAYKKILLYGNANSQTPAFPTINQIIEPSVDSGIATGIVERTRALVKRLKVSPNYNEAVGQDYQVINSSQSQQSLADAQPNLKIKALPNSIVEISFIKSDSDGLELEMQRGNETGWTKIGKFVKNPIADDTPTVTPNTPEVRRYRGCYLDGNTSVGLFSDIVTVVTTP